MRLPDVCIVDMDFINFAAFVGSGLDVWGPFEVLEVLRAWGISGCLAFTASVASVPDDEGQKFCLKLTVLNATRPTLYFFSPLSLERLFHFECSLLDSGLS